MKANIKKYIAVTLLVALVVVVASCRKSRYCHCVSGNYTIVINADTVTRADTAVVNVDRGMKCDHILNLTFRTKDQGPVILTERDVTCVELDVDTVKTLP